MSRAMPPVPDNEQERIEALRQYRVLDTAAEPIFDSITSLAAAICETPIAVLTLVDERRQWFKSKIGLQVPETDRQIAFCSHTIANTTDLFEVEDARSDPRFRDNPLVLSSPDIRSYAGAPLVTAEGHALGSLAVINTRPKRLEPKQRELLSELARTAMLLLDLRRTGWESSAPYQVLFQASPLPILELAKNAEVRLWNRAAELLFDWPSKEVMGRFNPLVLEEDRETYLQAIETVFDQNRNIELEGKRRCRDGTMLDMRAFLSPVRSETGSVISVIAILQDVTESRRAQRELEQSLSVLSATLDATADGILVVNREGRYVAQNRIFREIWGLPEDAQACLDQDLLQRTADRLRDPHAFLEKVQQLYRYPELESFDVLEFKDGRTIERYSKPQRIGTEIVGRVWSFRDVTSRVNLEHHFRQSQKLEAIGALAGGVAHDFNNLLNVIIGYTSLITANLRPSDRNLEYAKNVRAAADSAANLTRQLLAFSRQQVLHPKPLDMNETVRKLSEMLPRVLPEHIDFRLQLSQNPLPIKADLSQIEQVLMNLVVNARDAMPNGGSLTIRTSIADSPAGMAQIEVSDTGHGIEPALLDRIFDPFFTTKEVGKGTGLGLSTVYGIVRQSGGEVRVNTELGRGTTFAITFPLTEEIVAAGATVVTSADSGDRKNECILVVEDNAALRTLTVHLLERAGYKALEAPTGHEALTRIRQLEKLDLLLSDVIMPGMSGRELAQEACSIRPGLPIVLMSGYSEDALEKPCPTVLFLQKPFSPEALFARVREALDLRIQPAA